MESRRAPGRDADIASTVCTIIDSSVSYGYSSRCDFIDSEFLQNPPADFNVRSRDFVVHRFSDVVKKRAFLRYRDVGPYFRGEHTRKMRHFNRMLENILSVACAEAQPSQERLEPRIQVKNLHLVCGFFSRFVDLLFDFFARFFYGFFDSRRLDPSVLDKHFKRG